MILEINSNNLKDCIMIQSTEIFNYRSGGQVCYQDTINIF